MVSGGRVSVEQGRLLMKALDAMVADMDDDERAAAENVSAETLSGAKHGRPPLKPLRVRRATALVQIAEHYLAHRELHWRTAVE